MIELEIVQSLSSYLCYGGRDMHFLNIYTYIWSIIRDILHSSGTLIAAGERSEYLITHYLNSKQIINHA